MAHFPKPFFKATRNRWYLQLGKKQYNLGPNEDEAHKQYHELMRQHGEGVVPEPEPGALTVVELLDRFLENC